VHFIEISMNLNLIKNPSNLQVCKANRRTALAITTTLIPTMSSLSNAPAKAVPELPLVPTTTFPTGGLEISRVIKGCWQLSGGHAGEHETDRTSGNAAVEDFQKFAAAGITTFDTADIYGPSEGLIGKYLAATTKSSSAPPVTVLTKFCCFGDSMRKAADFKFVENSIETSRKRLGVDTIPLIQFYWHDYQNKTYIQAAQHLQTLKNKGKIRSIGVTNFDVPRMKEMMDAGMEIVSNQVQYSLLDRRPENAMVQYCKDNGIVLLPYGVTAGGFLSDKYLGVNVSDVKVNTYSKSKYASVLNEFGGWGPLQELLQVLHSIAEKHSSSSSSSSSNDGSSSSISIADVAQKWVLDKPTVAGVIIGARNADHVDDHRRLFTFDLSSEDRQAIDAVLAKGGASKGDCYSWERGGEW
jgi:aryl-alcohol dehydrogenase-like predicted oxidoreductase